jgi:hypothetical protein
MNLFQIIMVSLAAALGLSVFAGPVWAYVKDVLFIGKGDSILLDRLDKLKPNEERKHLTLTDVVKEWEELRITCEKANLDKAVEQLDVIFPLLCQREKGDQNVQNI